MSGTTDTVLAVGLGNPLLGDDAVGLRVIEELRRLERRAPGTLPRGTRLVAAGAPSLDLLDAVGEAGALLLVDAVERGGRPGSILVRRGAAVTATVGRGPTGDLLTAARLTGRHPAALALIGIDVAAVETRLGVSPSVEAAVPEAVRRARRELTRLADRARTTLDPGEELSSPAEGVCA